MDVGGVGGLVEGEGDGGGVGKGDGGDIGVVIRVEEDAPLGGVDEG